jgi:DNA helicase-2/ATP-dependent DNA helicase PcrA
VAGAALRDLAAEIEWATARLITPERYPVEAQLAGRRLPVEAEAMASLFARYRAEKQRRRVADFDDLLDRCASAMERDPAFAAVQRWRWRHIFVDEFQDLNPLQYRLLRAWLGDRRDICVVGDPNQAVYGWNGADAGLLGRLPAAWPGTEVIKLDDNHRCTPQVVAAASRVLGFAGRDALSSRPDGPPTTIRGYPDEGAEAHGVVGEARRARQDGRPWSQMAILVRTNAQVTAFESACRTAQVPYRLAGARPFLDDPTIRVLVGELGCRRGEPFAVVVSDLADMAAASPVGSSPVPSPVGSSPVPSSAGSSAGVAGRASGARLLVGLATDFLRMEARPTIDGFLGWLGPATSRDRVDDGASGVTISTFHRAKGLEWPVVWVTGLEEGFVPIAHARTDQAEAEERRLLYVALTRAGDELHCSWAEERTFGEHRTPRRPSPWLAAIAAPGTAEPTALDAPSGAWQAKMAASRDQLARCRRPGSMRRGAEEPSADAAVVDALRAWRASAARAAGVPAHVLLHDATLAAVAARRPVTADDLLGVPGLGPVKVARFGAVLLDLVAAV